VCGYPVGKIAKKQSEGVLFLLIRYLGTKYNAILSKIHSYGPLFGDFAHWIAL